MNDLPSWPGEPGGLLPVALVAAPAELDGVLTIRCKDRDRLAATVPWSRQWGRARALHATRLLELQKASRGR